MSVLWCVAVKVSFSGGVWVPSLLISSCLGDLICIPKFSYARHPHTRVHLCLSFWLNAIQPTAVGYLELDFPHNSVWNGTSYSYGRLSILPQAPRFTSQWMCVIQQASLSLRLGNPPWYLYPSLVCHHALELSLLSALYPSTWHCNSNQGHRSGPISSACFLSLNSSKPKPCDGAITPSPVYN